MSGRGYAFRRPSQRGRGAGRGRGRGAGLPSSKKWVRPQDDEAETSQTVETAAAAAQTQSTVASPKRAAAGPVLKGPRHSSRTWKRPVEEKETRGDENKKKKERSKVSKKRDRNKRDKQADDGGGSADDSGSDGSENDEPPPLPVHDPTVMAMLQRNGPYSLLMEKSRRESLLQKEAALAKQKLESLRREHEQPVAITTTMQKRGRHKLVSLPSATSPAAQSTLNTLAAFATSKPFENPPRNNKLVLSTRPQATTSPYPMLLRPPRRQQQQQQHMGPPVKRIRLNPSTDEADASPQEQAESATSAKQPSHHHHPDGATRLTEFAYRTTSAAVSSRGRGRGRGRGLGRGHGRGRTNMGLVRVEPDASTTPICPTFLRGIPCQNEQCTKRHDVPKKAAMPICSFFQRQGQCLKGQDCPFRHVKVNPRALECPSFSLLGFCADAECVMKHVRPPHTSTNKSITTRGDGKMKKS